MQNGTDSISMAMWLLIALGMAIAGYAVLVIAGWRSYGRRGVGDGDGADDALLDRFLPWYEVREHHHTEVAAPMAVTFEAACGISLFDSWPIRAIIRAREWAVGADHEQGRPRRRGIVEEAKSMGWGVLLEIPGREIVMGAVTQPWEKHVVFHALPPELFADFCQPGFVKIVWTLRVDPAGAGKSTYRTETRACATGEWARAKFHRYWAFFSPGIVLIRWIAIGRVKSEAERAARLHNAARFQQAAGSVTHLKDSAAHRH